MKTMQTLRVRSYIHYDPERTDYSVTEEELKRLSEGEHNLWKDVCLVSVSLGIPTLINGISEVRSQTSFVLTLPLFLNCLVGILGLSLGLIFGIAWYRSHRSLHALVEFIRQKPKMEVVLPQAIDVGSLPSVHLTETVPT